MRVYKGIALNHLNPTDPGFVDALRSALNEMNLFLHAVQRELSPTQSGSVASSGAANTESFVVMAGSGDLSNERILAGTSPIGISDGGAGGNVNVTLSGTVPVANGGTGSTTASGARSNLGADKISANGTDGVDVDLDDATPAAPADGFNIRFQNDASSPMNVSGNAPVVAPAFTFGTTSNAGSAANTVRSDAQISLFSATNPTQVAPDNVASPGSGSKAARRDHIHDVAVGTPAVTLSSSFSDGVANSLLRSDAQIKAKSDSGFMSSTAQTGLINKDTQGTARYWDLYVKEGATTPASGDVTINISSLGVVTATRAGGAAGDVTIVIKDRGTSAPF